MKKAASNDVLAAFFYVIDDVILSLELVVNTELYVCSVEVNAE